MAATQTMTTDTELLALLREPHSQEQGFRLLMRTHQERLYWHVRRMVGQHDDADDVLQATFIRAWRNIGNFKGESKLFTWLYRIATNESITFLNKKKTKVTFSMDDDATINWGETLPAATALLDSTEITEKLEAAIATLPEKQRIVFSMRYYDEIPYKEMSETLGTTEGALKASYHHALKKIEAFLVT
jgi:RNA polymerase sigma factor (sigma-70 family)